MKECRSNLRLSIVVLDRQTFNMSAMLPSRGDGLQSDLTGAATSRLMSQEWKATKVKRGGGAPIGSHVGDGHPDQA